MTDRGIGVTLRRELEDIGAWPIWIFKAELDSGDVRLWSGAGDLSFNLETYSGIGDFAQIVAFEESMNALATKITYKLSGIDTTGQSITGFREAIGKDVNEPVRGKAIKLWIAALTSDGTVFVGTPFQIRSDVGDMITLIDRPEDGELSINLTAETSARDFRRKRTITYSRADQRAKNTTDAFFDEEMWRRKSFPWGRKTDEE